MKCIFINENKYNVKDSKDGFINKRKERIQTLELKQGPKMAGNKFLDKKKTMLITFKFLYF